MNLNTCSVCNKSLHEDDIVWAISGAGWLSVSYGRPYCEKHAPTETAIDMREVGTLIRSCRKENKVSLAKFAASSGISVPTLIKVEHGDLNIRLRTVLAVLKQGLGVDVVLGAVPNG